MAVGLDAPQDLLPVPGVSLATAATGARYQGRDDLALLALPATATTVVSFTQNAFQAAPVILARQHLARTRPRYLLINAGHANAGTGAAGMAAALSCCEQFAAQAGVAAAAILPFSTGVIGELLPLAPLVNAFPRLLADLRDDANAWLAAARAIMTTDTLPKAASAQATLSTGVVTVTGMAKGAGMICPDMATLLAFVATDANLSGAQLQALQARLLAQSFNRITVDGDTSTNDACALLASGTAMPTPVSEPADLAALESALAVVYRQLAQAIVRDAEGATKFVQIRVTGAASAAAADGVARTVAHSPLVKTALFASDPNWGRILAAVGRAEIPALAIEQVSISLNGVCCVAHGARAADYTEAAGQAAFAEPELDILIELGQGEHTASVWTSDLSHEYVRINAEYRT